MAEGMGYSIGAGGDLAAALEQMKAAAKDVKRELADIRKQEREVKRAGGQLSAEQQARKQTLIQQQEQFKATMAAERERQKARREADKRARDLERQRAARLARFRAGISSPMRLMGGFGLGDAEVAIARLGSGMDEASKRLAKRAQEMVAGSSRHRLAKRAAVMLGSTSEALMTAAGPIGIAATAGAALAYTALGAVQGYGQDMLAAARDNAETEQQFMRLARSDLYGSRYSTEFQQRAKARVNAAAARAKEAMRKSSLIERARGMVGMSPSSEATAMAVRAENVEFRRVMEERRWGTKYAKYTSVKSSAAKAWIKTQLRRELRKKYGGLVDYADSGLAARAMMGPGAALVPIAKVLIDQERERLRADLEVKWRDMRDKQWKQQLREADPRLDENRRYEYRANEMENQVHLDAVAREQYERSMQWNSY